MRKPPEIEALFIVCCFEHVVRDVVLAAKYAANRRALALMATMMSQCSLPAVDVLLPMPISRGRLLQRGFNQTHYLAAAMAKHYDLPMNKALLVKQGRGGGAEAEEYSRGVFGAGRVSAVGVIVG